MFRVFWAYLWWRGHSYLPADTAAYRGYGLAGNRCHTRAAGRIKGRWYTGNRCASTEPLNHWSQHAQLPALILLRRHTKAQCTQSVQDRTLNLRRPWGEQRAWWQERCQEVAEDSAKPGRRNRTPIVHHSEVRNSSTCRTPTPSLTAPTLLQWESRRAESMPSNTHTSLTSQLELLTGVQTLQNILI